MGRASVALGILWLVLVGTAIGLLLTSIGLLYTDIGRGLPLVMQFLMHITPVVFPMPKEGWAVTLFNRSGARGRGAAAGGW